MNTKWVAFLAIAVLAFGINAASASAADDPSIVSTGSGITIGTPSVDPTTVSPRGAGTAYCNTAVYWRAAYNAAGITVAKIWNHMHWCYYYGGSIYSRTGYTDVYTGLLWDVNSVAWAKGWWTQPTSWYARATAHFFLNAAGYHAQSWNPDVCIRGGNRGGTAWC